MKALFLAGGNGTRLHPLTENVPKPMVPIMNKPLIERTMVNLKKFGISDIVISNCYKPYYMKKYFGDGKKLGLNIQYVVEDYPLGTGGAIKNTETHFNDTFVIFNSDILFDVDIKKMFEFHKSRHALMTIAVTEVEDPTVYGVIDVDQMDYAVSFKEKPKLEEVSSRFINAGIYIFEPEVFKQIPAGTVVSLEREVFPKILDNGDKIAVFKNDGYWMDIGTPEKYMQAHKDIMNKKGTLFNSYFNKRNIVVGENVSIHPKAIIEGSVFIGDNVKIGANVYISNSVIGNNITISPESKVIDSILWDDVNIGRDAKLYSTIILSGSNISRNSVFSKTIITSKENQSIAI